MNLRVPSDSHRSGELTFDPTTTAGPNGGGLGLASFLMGEVQSFGRYVSNSTDAAEFQNVLLSTGLLPSLEEKAKELSIQLAGNLRFNATVTGARTPANGDSRRLNLQVSSAAP